ncbi:isoleucine--tRNA ligase [Atopobacter sp. AH10]|uniref:isoleucine--tRNA ligase n=1 Tax=Atopobacter sp. AH10 TaxID=2315861 RepID=UPI000EF29474|nr:isoleucine--tRNA ligase [Atopobacter sp. AH10]RLK63653.1 isoleucine--tRNA ligase [Atopobacter sp. AH10]
MKMKETLQLGKTKFPMRGNLPVKEVERQAEWAEQEVTKRRLKQNEGHDSFILHDGPPYANGAIHMGHALNKLSKDIIVRSKLMQGYYAPFVPGWDTHGLPIEQALKNAEGVDRKKLSVAKFRELCEEYAKKQVAGQKETFKRLGVQGEWDHPYLTLHHEYEAAQIRVFGKMAEKGYIYKGLKPIYWSPSSESSLAEAEIEYKDVESDTIFVAFKVRDGKDVLPADAEFVIWTTTPWTIPSNLGICANANFNYVILSAKGRKLVVAEELAANLAQKMGVTDYELSEPFKGEKLEYLTATHPLYDRESLLMLGDHVTLDAGTGLVHTAPGHGEDDYYVSKQYGIEPLSPVDNEGKFTAEAPGFEGKFYADVNKEVIELLRENGSLLAHEKIVHSYPHDWRTKKPVIFRATPQWFASIDKFRSDILQVIDEEVNWLHPSGQRRIHNMVRDRGDWVISRQRVWGVPLPIFYAENGEEIITPETTEHVANLFAEHGSNIWFEKEAKELLPEGFTHPGSPNGKFTKENDIMDVWFDSGSSYAGVLEERDNLSFPADLYLEGSDQYRGWFNSSLTTSVAVHGCAPYKAVLSQGFVNDGQGRKMSKSVGNVISPDTVMKQRGADIIRLWTAQVDYTGDVRISDEILDQVAEGYRKIRNTFRFMLANTTDFEPSQDRVKEADLRPVDRYMMARLRQVIREVTEAYNAYEFSNVYKTIMQFVTADLSQFYLDFAKDVVYIELADGYNRRCMQTVIYDSLVAMTKLLTPILVHTCEEVWSYLKEEEDYVQLANFPLVEEVEEDEKVLAQWHEFMTLRLDLLKSLELARDAKKIGKSFEAKLTIYTDQATKEVYEALSSDLSQILIVAGLDITTDKAKDTADVYERQSVVVEHAKGEVCERCRATREEVGTIEGAPTLCQRCYDIVHEHYPEALTNPEA